MTNQDSLINFEWAEVLPLNCPPQEAKIPQNQMLYRLIATVPAREEDFYSQRKLFPEKEFHADECIARALSIFDNPEQCAQQRKFPLHKNKKVVRINLNQHSGVILRTGRTKGHHSWWLNKAYNPLSNYELVDI